MGQAMPRADRALMRVLIADDSPADRSSLRKILERIEPQAGVDEAMDGAEAIRRLRSTEYDLVLADLLMPRVDGVDVLRAAAELQPGALRVMVSHVEDIHAVERAINLGRIHAYLRKAHAPDQTTRILQSFLDETLAG